MHEEDHEEEEEGCIGGPMEKKEFILAKLEKKEKIFEAKLEFIRKMKAMVKKMPEPPKPKDRK